MLSAAACSTPGPYEYAQDFEGANSKTAFQLEARGAGVVVEGGQGEKLYVVTPEESGVSIRGAHGEALGSVIPLEGGRGYVVMDATGREIYKLLFEADGDFKLRNTEGQNLYVGKMRSYGFKVLNAAEEVESRVKVRGSRVSIRDGDDQKFLSAKVERPEPVAMAILTLKDIPFSYAAGLSVALTRDRYIPEGAPGS
jgi:hypothetical protein